MKKSFIYWYLIVILTYNFLYRYVLLSINEIFQYIINPLIWLIFLSILYFTKFQVKHKRESNNTIIIFIVSLIQMILFYGSGLITGYANNPYVIGLSNLIVNLFSLWLVVVIKERIREQLLNGKNKIRYHNFIILFIFVLSDLDIFMLNNYSYYLNEVINVIVINIFMNYLAINIGYKASFIYRTITFLPLLILNVIPNSNWLINILLTGLSFFVTYLFLEYNLNFKNKYLPRRITKTFRPRGLITTFLLFLILILFGMGIFPIRPIVVMTGSMRPNINEGDLVLILKVPASQIAEGDIAEYQLEDYTVIHRVIKKNNSVTYQFKGDNNLYPDQKLVTSDQIIGKYMFKIPYLGYPTYLIKKIINDNK